MWRVTPVVGRTQPLTGTWRGRLGPDPEAVSWRRGGMRGERCSAWRHAQPYGLHCTTQSPHNSPLLGPGWLQTTHPQMPCVLRLTGRTTGREDVEEGVEE
ncbi:hypothetical protein DPEC_G00117280 [Dallia pectoralis]|uniref:Uncharacterized protein n=1 Tax=Dallia pectoralis TaxID=75939 RepID=A0ACC2GV28_DALPE|nr:hypothetical protein DPEC_G00117280 [Dallia pectoralis]